jgi:hypothetical protein
MKLARHKDFDSFLDDLTPEERTICLLLKNLIQDNFPELRVSWAYGVPYFSAKKRIFFLYPASFPYSGINQGVNLGFTRGYLLSNTQGLLDMGSRKEVGYLCIPFPGAIETDVILEFLHEAVLLDQMPPK